MSDESVRSMLAREAEEAEAVADAAERIGWTGLTYDAERDLYVDSTGREPDWQRRKRQVEESCRGDE